MKMATLNISLPKPMEDYVRARCEREYGNISEFFRDLVRQKMQTEVEADLKLLEEASAGAEVGPTAAEIEEVVALQKRVRKDLRARRA